MRLFPVERGITWVHLTDMTEFSHFWPIFDRSGYILAKIDNIFRILRLFPVERGIGDTLTIPALFGHF